MFDDFEGYFFENIIIPLKVYLKEKKSKTAGNNVLLRTATDLCIKLFHLKEHLPPKRFLSVSVLIDICPEYRIVKDICHVTKHKKIRKHKPLITNSENIYEIAVITTYRDKQGEFNHIENTVFADLDDGTQVDLHTIIAKVYNMWLNELKNFDLLTHEYKPITISTRKPRRSKQTGQHNITVTQGIRLKKQFKIQKFNYEKGIIEPVDLTGYKAKWPIFEKRYDLTLELTHKETGECKSFTAKVNKAQIKKFKNNSLTPELIKEFLKIAKEQGKI